MKKKKERKGRRVERTSSKETRQERRSTENRTKQQPGNDLPLLLLFFFRVGGSFAPADAYQGFLDRLMAMKQDDVEEEDDPDIKEDPLNQMSVEVKQKMLFFSILFELPSLFHLPFFLFPSVLTLFLFPFLPFPSILCSLSSSSSLLFSSLPSPPLLLFSSSLLILFLNRTS